VAAANPVPKSVAIVFGASAPGKFDAAFTMLDWV
jgi:hypothetical protein